MTSPATELRYDVIHQSYNDIAHIRDHGITPGYDLDWETRDSFERHMIEVHDEELYEALEELWDEMKTLRGNAGNEYTHDDLPTTPQDFFEYLEGKDDPESRLTIDIYDNTVKKTTEGYSEDVTTLSEVVTTFEVPFGVAEDGEKLRTLMHETDKAPEAYIELLDAFPEGYEDLNRTIRQEGVRETILETSNWQLNYASLEQQASTVEIMLDERIRQMGETGG